MSANLSVGLFCRDQRHENKQATKKKNNKKKQKSQIQIQDKDFVL